MISLVKGHRCFGCYFIPFKMMFNAILVGTLKGIRDCEAPSNIHDLELILSA